MVCDKSIDNVVGVVQAKDLLDRILGGGELSVGASLRQPMVVPDTISALDALERLKSDPLGLALVMDEYGSFEGVVTAADVLQAIVGEASGPEHQEGVPGPEGETTMTLDGMTPVDELKARLDRCRTCRPRAAIIRWPGCCWRCCGGCRRSGTGSCSAAGGSRCWRWTDGAWTR